VLAVLQRNTVLGHGHRRYDAVLVFLNDGPCLRLPDLAVIGAAVHGQLRILVKADVLVFGEREDVTAGLVDRQPAALPTGIGDGDRFAPGLAAVLATADLEAHFPPVARAPGRAVCCQHRTVCRDHHVGQAPPGEQLVHLELRLPQKRIDCPLDRLFGGDKRDRQKGRGESEAGQRKETGLHDGSPRTSAFMGYFSYCFFEVS
jgi:hypothetical protein